MSIPDASVSGVVTLKSEYERQTTDRQTFLDRAIQCAELTIPTLIPPLGHTKTTKYYTPWQGIGARGVNNLASKLLLSLLPPNSPFFRLTIDDYSKAKLAKDPSLGSQIEQGLAAIERAVQNEVETSGIRSPVFLSLKHLIVGGNVFVYLPKEGGARVFNLHNYVVVRDPKGNVLKVITKEKISPASLKPELRAKVEQAEGEKTKPDKDKKDEYEETIEVYTVFKREDKWIMYQEVNGQKVPDSDGSWPIDKAPFMALRWTAVEGENYGRSYVEEYLGDLVSLEGLSKAIVEAAAASAKVVFLVAPNGMTRAKDITEAESGDAIPGHVDDVHALQTEKQADLRIAYEAVKTISERLAYAFLMNSAIQRNGERVTAEEIRYMAGELEDALGGVYSIMSQEFQLPLVTRLLDRLTKQKRIPDLPKGIVKPAIVTGLEALGRGHDLNKLNTFMQGVAAIGPNAMAYISIPELLARFANGLSIDPAGLVKTDQAVQEEQQAQQQQAMQAEMAKQGTGPAIKAMSDQVIAAGQQGQASQGPPN